MDHVPSPTDNEPGQRRATWPDRLIALGTAFQETLELQERARIQGEVWLLLQTVLETRIRVESRRLGPIGNEDLRDLASQKALEMMNMLEVQRWKLGESSRATVIAFVSTVARNGLIDHLRQTGRRGVVEDVDLESVVELASAKPDGLNPEITAERSRFIDALFGCAEKLKPAHRTAWMFRVFLELPSKVIARHPEVCLKAGHVDVILQRCRGHVSECMRAKGYEPFDIPPGTFAELWRAFRVDEMIARTGTIDG